MFGPDWTAACPACSTLADHLDRAIPHLNARDVTMVCISHAPLEKLWAYKLRMGWQFPYVSAFRSDFSYDLGASFTEEQQREIADQILDEFAKSDTMAELATSCGTDLVGYLTTEGPGLSAFALEHDVVYHTYFSSDTVGFMMFYAQLLERAPKGGKEGVPIRRHDEYELTADGAHR